MLIQIALGTHYEQFDSHYLATPLFVKALELCPPKSCHSVVLSKFPCLHITFTLANFPLVNNISTCLVQQNPPPSSAITMSSAPSDFPVTNTAPRTLLIDQARQWATKALVHANSIKSPDRTEECDFGCAVATHNLGEFFEMEGKIKEAKQQYQEAATMAKSMGFAEGQTNARAGLRRLMELEKKAS